MTIWSNSVKPTMNIEYLMTEILDFLMTENDDFLITNQSTEYSNDNKNTNSWVNDSK